MSAVAAEFEAAQPAPSATRIPIIGGVPALLRHKLAFLEHARDRVGDIYRLDLGLAQMIMLNRPEQAQHVFVDNAANYRKQGAFWAALAKIFGSGLPVLEGEAWLRQRRMMQPHFHRAELAGLSDLMIDAIVECLDRWPRPDAPAFDIGGACPRIAVKVAMRALFGSSVDFELLDRLGDDLRTVVEHVTVDIVTGSFPTWVPIPGRRRSREAHARVRAAVEDIIASARPRSLAGEGGDLLAMLVRATDAETGEGMSDAQLRDEAITLFLAGYDTTSLCMAWVFHYLTQHPAALVRARIEVDAVLGDRRPRFEDLARLDYLRMVIRETLRLRPPAWFISRTAVHDDVIDGVRIPAGAEVACSMYGIHHNPDVWPEPERFEPERFEPERTRERHRLAWIPFGAGQRLCIGKEFALIEAQLVLALVLQRYSIAAIPGRVAEPMLSAAMRPKAGVWVELRGR